MNQLIFFDIDGTLVAGQTQKMLAEYLFKKGKLNLFTALKIYFWFLLFKMNMAKNIESIMKKSYQLIKGWPIDKVKKILLEFFDKEVKPKIFPQALKIVKEHLAKGSEVILISNTIQPLVDIIKDYLDVNGGLGTKLEIIDGIYTGNIIGNVIYGENKAELIKKFLRDEGAIDSYFYTDHFNDLPSLKLVKYPVATNPDNILKKIALSNNWPILNFKL